METMIFETHAHYDDAAFDGDRKELLLSMAEHGIGPIVNVGADLASCRTSLALAGEYPFVYAAVGVHPSGVEELNDQLLGELKKLCLEQSVKKGGKVVAVGETGLDYNWRDGEQENEAQQKEWFGRQIQMAKEVSLPLIVHSRDAAKDTLDLMKAHRAGEAGGIVHCYSYSKELAAAYLDMGFFFGIGGVITFKNGRKLREVVEYLPMDRIVLETDCPYLSPEPYRGRRNSSLNLPLIADRIGELKGISREEVIAITRQNAMSLYGLA